MPIMKMKEQPDTATLHRSAPAGSRPWSVNALVLLLVAQAIGLAAIVVLTGTRLEWLILVSGWIDPDRETAPLIIGGLFLPLAAIALSAALGIWLLRRTGWILAMLAQIALLLACLALYFDERPGFIYPLMLASIATVLYLNSSEARLTFQLAPPPAQEEAEDAA